MCGDPLSSPRYCAYGLFVVETLNGHRNAECCGTSPCQAPAVSVYQTCSLCSSVLGSNPCLPGTVLSRGAAAREGPSSPELPPHPPLWQPFRARAPSQGHGPDQQVWVSPLSVAALQPSATVMVAGTSSSSGCDGATPSVRPLRPRAGLPERRLLPAPRCRAAPKPPTGAGRAGNSLSLLSALRESPAPRQRPMVTRGLFFFFLLCNELLNLFQTIVVPLFDAHLVPPLALGGPGCLFDL